MFREFSKNLSGCVVAVVVAMLLIYTPSARTQTGSQGTIAVTVSDQSGGVVPGAALTLQDLSTNDVRKATTQSVGTYSFIGLSLGTYKLTVSSVGYKSVVYDSVIVHAALVTDVKVTLKVGAIHETVEVTASEVPLVEYTSNAIGGTIDLKQIEDLPLGDRDLTALATYVPGYAAGTWNNLPGAAQVNSIDGVIGQSSRFKDSGNAYNGTAASPRIQNIQEMAIQTDQLDSDQGYGQGNMQVAFVTRSGTNKFHGRLFADLQNSSFNANSWFNDYVISQGGLAPKPLYHKNDLGGSIGGPILKDKLFFFFSYERDDIPGQQQVNTSFMTPLMQSGIYTYDGTDGNVYQVNLLDPTVVPQGLPANPYVLDLGTQQSSEMAKINKAIKTPGASIVPMSGVPYNAEQVQFLEPNPQYFHYPTLRVDYNATQTMRFNFALNETTISQPNVYPQQFPGPDFAYQTAGFKSKAYTASLGFDWTIRPTLINQFRGGYLYNAAWNSPNQSQDPEKFRFINWWAGPDGLNPANGNFWYSAISNFYPLVNFSDNVVWQHRAHNLSLGTSFYREQDHYWNPRLGYNNIVFGGYPTGSPFPCGISDPCSTYLQPGQAAVPAAAQWQADEMQSFYSILTGDIGIMAYTVPLDPSNHTYDLLYGAWNLDERQQAWGLYMKDSWRVRPNLTVNYGLRWDFTGDDHDLQKLYYSPPAAGVWGVSGFHNNFNPGSELGNPNDFNYIGRGHAYSPWNVSPQPNIGIAWNPQFTEGILGKLTGGGKAVLRAGYSLHRYTEQYQSFWVYASNYGAFFYKNYSENGGPSASGSGEFKAGTAVFQGDSPAPQGSASNPTNYFASPPSFQAQISEASQAPYASLGAMDPHIAQPYIQSWNIGFQRQLGTGNAIEVRYVGNRGIHEWLGLNPNEVNIFENGFLPQFKGAQANLAAYEQATGCNLPTGTTPCSFANNGLAGQQALPLFDAAFAGEGAGPDGKAGDYTNGGYTTMLQLGQVGTLANVIASGAGLFYLCNLVPTTSLTGQMCSGPNVGYTGAGGTYPENLFQANPYYPFGTQYLTAAGYSNYNGLQVEFRQKSWHGMQYNANYTWSKSLGVTTQWTLRNLHAAYGPTSTDRHHTANIVGTYDLPFGKGKPYLSGHSLLDRAVGGWTIGSIITFTSGYPFQLTGGNNTFNNLFDGGVVLNGVTASQIQHAIGLHPAPSVNGFTRYWIDPKYLNISGSSSLPTSQIQPNAVPGTIGYQPWFYGMHHWAENFSISKAIRIREGMNFSLQGEFLNAFNHPEWDTGNASLQLNNFGQTGPPGGARTIEVRGNFEF